MRAEAERINTQFDCDLRLQIDGSLPIGYVYQLGRPGAVLLASGLDDLPMELESALLGAKSDTGYRRPHPFDLSGIKGLPMAVNGPIAVFRSTKNDGAKVILTDLKHGNHNFVAVMRVRKGKGRINAAVNNVVSLYPKDRVTDMLTWFKSGDRLIMWIDKEKALRYVSTQSPTNIVSGDPEGFIKSVQETIQSFSNPS
ncbi:MAG: hypothetical protein FWB85_12025 [Chitinispirillia bacterium]|nr:hypothetical protein [Chitinispirillia bacterium]